MTRYPQHKRTTADTIDRAGNGGRRIKAGSVIAACEGEHRGKGNLTVFKVYPNEVACQDSNGAICLVQIKHIL